MTSEKKALLEEIKKHFDQEKSFFTVVGYQNIQYVITELSAAWKREEIARECLQKMSTHKDDGGAEGYFGTEADEALKRMEQVK